MAPAAIRGPRPAATGSTPAATGPPRPAARPQITAQPTITRQLTAAERQRELTRLRVAAHRARQSEEKRQEQLRKDREYREARKRQMSQEQADQHREATRARVERHRTNTTESQRQERRDQETMRHRAAFRKAPLFKGAFTYDPKLEYNKHKLVEIGLITDVICEECHAQKFKGETPGMCCSNGKVLIVFLALDDSHVT